MTCGVDWFSRPYSPNKVDDGLCAGFRTLNERVSATKDKIDSPEDKRKLDVFLAMRYEQDQQTKPSGEHETYELYKIAKNYESCNPMRAAVIYLSAQDDFKQDS